MLVRFLFVSTLLLCCVTVGFAEDDRGRMPDGRAFRTDAQGVQLVDYIAELEVSVDELNRRVHGLQYEVEEKEDIIAALKRNGGRNPGIVEKDLLSQKTAREVLAVPLNETCPQVKPCPECSPIAMKPDNDQVVSQIRQEVSTLTAENARLRSTLASRNEMLSSYKTQMANDHSEQNSHAQLLQAQLDSEQEQSKKMLMSIGQLRAELEAFKQKKTYSGEEIQSIKADCQQSEEALNLLNAKLVEENEELKDQVTEVKQQLALANDNLVKAKGAAARSSNTVERASLSSRSIEQLGTARSELKTLFNRTRGMMYERDKRYKLYKQSSGNTLRVGMSSLRSERGLTLKQISSRIEAMRSMDEAANLRRDLLDIQQLVKSDLKVLSRVGSI